MAKLKTRTNQPVEDEEGLLDHIAQDDDTTEIGGNMYVDGILTANEIKEGSNHLVKIMDAPTSTTLTDDQIAQIKNGRFVNGEFDEYINPVFFPGYEQENDIRGFMIGSQKNYIVTWLVQYKITKATKVITFFKNAVISAGGRFNLVQFEIKDKIFPNIPTDASNKTYNLKLVNGEFQFVEEV